MSAISIRGLTHAYQKHFWQKRRKALSNLSLEVAEGEVFGFLGANGAGKTTTIKILVGLQSQTAGEADIFGNPVGSLECRRRTGFMPENPYFYEYLTAAESLAFYGALCDLPVKDCAEQADKLLEFVGLADAKDMRLKEFSKGMRQRLGIAQAIVHRPKLIILDEPMSGLDPVGRRQVREAILNLRSQGATIFFSSHILSDVEMICDRAALLDRGELLSVGGMDELLDAREREFEVGVSGLTAGEMAKLSEKAARSVSDERGTLFVFKERGDADAAAKLAVERDGLVSFGRIRESLEDYFMRTTGRSRSETEQAHADIRQ
ncbi:MAG: ABC transporter ATP-binding protein [Planctomycetota bacterium]|jgi:ABC-2 type transport system ATP-binding protein|nr:ABC transporter ATP-binding protein [Planctomycetota bacterium]